MQHPVVIKPSAVIHSQGEVLLPSCLLPSPWICLAQVFDHLQMRKGVVLSCALEMAYTKEQWFTNSTFIKEMCEAGLHISSRQLSFPRLQLSCHVPFAAARAVIVCPSVQQDLSPRPLKPSGRSRVANQLWDSCTCSRRPARPLASHFASSCQDFWWHSEETDIVSVHMWQLQRLHICKHGSVDTFLLSCGSLPQTVDSLIRLIYRVP